MQVPGFQKLQKERQAGETTNLDDQQPKKLSCNKTELKRCTSTDKRWNEKELSRSSPESLTMCLPNI